MKKILPIVIVIFTLSCSMLSIAASPAVLIQSYSLSPQVLYPGDNAVLTVMIQNADTAATETIVEGSGATTITTVRTVGVEIEEVRVIGDGEGSKKIRATNSFEDVGVIGPGSIIPISFDLRSDMNLSPGLYFPKIRIDLEGYDPIIYPVPIRITDENVELTTLNVPSQLSLSGSSDISLSVINHLSGNIDDVQISPMSASNLQITPMSVYLGTMTPSMSQIVQFSLNPAEMGTASVMFNLSYRNGNNQHYELLEIPFSIIEVLDVAPVISRFPSTIAQGSVERVTLEVYNAKTEDITGVIVTPITDVSISPSQYFIGSMSPDDVFSASFDVDTSSLDLAEYAIAFKVTFKQDNEYYETPVVSSSFEVTQAKQGGDQPSLLIPVGIVVVLGIIILFFYMRRRKRRLD